MNSAWFDEQISREFTVNEFTTILNLFSTIFTSFMVGMQLHERSVCEKNPFSSAKNASTLQVIGGERERFCCLRNGCSEKKNLLYSR